MGAPLNPVPQVVRCFLEGFVDNDDVYKWGNVVHFHYTGIAPTVAQLNTVAGNIAGSWAAFMAPECPAPTHLTSVTLTDLTSDAAAAGAWSGNEPGTRGDDSIPANAAVLISYPSTTRFKGGHGRSYLYVLGNADLEGAAHWSALATAEVQSHWQSFLNGLTGVAWTGGGADSVGWVRFRGKYLPNGGPPHYYLDSPIYEPITIAQAIAHAEMASQRRRVGRRKA